MFLAVQLLPVSISLSPSGVMSNGLQALACYTTDDLVIYKTFQSTWEFYKVQENKKSKLIHFGENEPLCL